MKRELFGDDASLASQKMIKLPGCVAIEDALSKEDFAKFVIKDNTVSFPGTNAEYVKSTSRSKPVLAFGFALAVDEGQVSLELLSDDSKARLKTIVDAIKERLS